MNNRMLQIEDGVQFRDLNKNGRMDPYEDPRRPVEERVDDLLAQMTLEEKAGMLFHNFLPMNEDGTLFEGQGRHGPVSTAELVLYKLMNHFNLFRVIEAGAMAQWYNRLQELAETTRLGIPITIASDPRHGYADNPATSFTGEGLSQWPEPLGLAAIGDEALVEEFGNIARQEYVALGIRTAEHPMADLATEPRWARISGTFGEDAHLSARMTAAYIRGFQGAELGPESVACMTKHFPGGGPQKDGEDPHFPYGKEQVYPGDKFEYHLIPFEAAFEAGTAQIMPYYGMPIGTQYEQVGFAFNREVITDLLRRRYGFDGVVCTDWVLLTDTERAEARAWGVEHLSRHERAKQALEAGVDQFGGETCPEVIVELVRNGQVSEERIDESVRRLLRDKFRLGLFDDPYADPDKAQRVVGNAEFCAAGELAQRKAIVLLKNDSSSGVPVLPLAGRPKVYIENVARDVAQQYCDVVDDLEQAELAILRLQTPYEPRDNFFLESRMHAGDLDFKEPEKSRILSILDQVPTIVDIYLDRGAVIPEIVQACVGLLANFGASDAAVLDVIFGRFAPSGRLPLELPSSMDAVRTQKSDVPYDSEDPLFPFGHGLAYTGLT